MLMRVNATYYTLSCHSILSVMRSGGVIRTVQSQDKKRVLIAVNLQIVGMGLRAALAMEGNLMVVAEVTAKPALFEALETLEPDLILLDSAFAGPPCHHLIAELRQLRPGTKIALFAGVQSQHEVIEGLRAGINGFIAKVAATTELLLALVSILRGQTYLSPEFAGYVIDHRLGNGTNDAGNHCGQLLSRRELEILRLVASGLTSREIAHRLFISPRTVEKHRASLMHKVGVNHTAGLLSYAFNHGFVENNVPQSLPVMAIDYHPEAAKHDVVLQQSI